MEVSTYEDRFHGRRVAAYTCLLYEQGLKDGIYAGEPGMDRTLLPVLFESVLLHDIGSAGDETQIRESPPGDSGWTVNHCCLGAEKILSGVMEKGDSLDEREITVLKLAYDVAVDHHEHWDGSGYPFGKSGTAISPAGRACAIAEAYDRLTRGIAGHSNYDRYPGVPGRLVSHEEACEVILAGAGTLFDPLFAQSFLKITPKILQMNQSFDLNN
ncbi:HD-GYP domain-containing protein [Anaerolentibacter hominis]|uniref:HD-GYP domain-containing protein n=1 Tax=Anaerolentibacter hominis TaxID=3079009 RepID=UPI0031B83B2E